MASDTTSDGFDYSGPLSKRAIQLMRELQGLRLFDTDSAGTVPVEPTLGVGGSSPASSFAAHAFTPGSVSGVSSASSSRQGGGKGSTRTSRFNREAYLRDTRSSYSGSLAVSIFILMVVLAVALVASWKVLLPRLNAMNEQVQLIATAPTEITALRTKVQAKTEQKVSAQARLSAVQSQLMSPEGSLDAMTQFLVSLREGRVQLLSQRNSISQVTDNPYVAAGRAGAARGTAAPAASAVIKSGLNYNHYELVLSGSYSGYIFARQTLVGMVPNLIIHYEDIGAMDQNPAQLNIRVFLSLPFLAK